MTTMTATVAIAPGDYCQCYIDYTLNTTTIYYFYYSTAFCFLLLLQLKLLIQLL